MPFGLTEMVDKDLGALFKYNNLRNFKTNSFACNSRLENTAL